MAPVGQSKTWPRGWGSINDVSPGSAHPQPSEPEGPGAWAHVLEAVVVEDEESRMAMADDREPESGASPRVDEDVGTLYCVTWEDGTVSLVIETVMAEIRIDQVGATGENRGHRS